MEMSKNILSFYHGSGLFLYLRDGKIDGVVRIFWCWIELFSMLSEHVTSENFLDPEGGVLSADII